MRKWGCVEGDSRNEEERGREGGKARACVLGVGGLKKKRKGAKRNTGFLGLFLPPNYFFPSSAQEDQFGSLCEKF